MRLANLVCAGLAFLSVDAVGMTPSEVECLTKNLYHEARGESRKGQIAVALVTLNRVKSGKFPSTVCGVVYQAKQFSWTAKEPKIKDRKKYKELERLTRNVLLGKVHTDFTGGSLWYHAEYVSPKWADAFSRTTKVGRHIFYREAA